MHSELKKIKTDLSYKIELDVSSRYRDMSRLRSDLKKLTSKRDDLKTELHSFYRLIKGMSKKKTEEVAPILSRIKSELRETQRQIKSVSFSLKGMKRECSAMYQLVAELRKD